MKSTSKHRKTRPKAAAPARSGGVADRPAPDYLAATGTARVFQSGNSQAVRLPKEFRVKSDELLIFRRGNDIVLREKHLKLSEALANVPAAKRLSG